MEERSDKSALDSRRRYLVQICPHVCVLWNISDSQRHIHEENTELAEILWNDCCVPDFLAALAQFANLKCPH